MKRALQAASEAVFPEVVRLRRHLHQHPELALQEHETARLVQETLTPLGLDITPGVYHTGVVATLHGEQPGPTRLLRADMDALPILEENTFDFASEHEGVMHACGHDGHTASLLGTAMILAKHKADLKGAVRFIFQPSEEELPGGAKFMIEEGAVGKYHNTAPPKFAFGQHVMPHLPSGTIGVRGGRFMASTDTLDIIIHGQGGHAAAPHLLSADPVYVAAQVIVALQSIVSRNCPPGVPSVLSFGQLHANGAHNVIPDTVAMRGTFRAMDEAWRAKAHGLIRRVVEETASSLGARATFELTHGYPALFNDAKVAEQVKTAAEEFVGSENVVEADLWFAAEDFAYFLREMPGTFFVLGTGNESAGITNGLHTPRFTIDESALRLAPGFMAYLAWKSGESVWTEG